MGWRRCQNMNGSWLDPAEKWVWTRFWLALSPPYGACRVSLQMVSAGGCHQQCRGCSVRGWIAGFSHAYTINRNKMLKGSFTVNSRRRCQCHLSCVYRQGVSFKANTAPTNASIEESTHWPWSEGHFSRSTHISLTLFPSE